MRPVTLTSQLVLAACCWTLTGCQTLLDVKKSPTLVDQKLPAVQVDQTGTVVDPDKFKPAGGGGRTVIDEADEALVRQAALKKHLLGDTASSTPLDQPNSAHLVMNRQLDLINGKLDQLMIDVAELQSGVGGSIETPAAAHWPDKRLETIENQLSLLTGELQFLAEQKTRTTRQLNPQPGAMADRDDATRLPFRNAAVSDRGRPSANPRSLPDAHYTARPLHDESEFDSHDASVAQWDAELDQRADRMLNKYIRNRHRDESAAEADFRGEDQTERIRMRLTPAPPTTADRSERRDVSRSVAPPADMGHSAHIPTTARSPLPDLRQSQARSETTTEQQPTVLDTSSYQPHHIPNSAAPAQSSAAPTAGSSTPSTAAAEAQRLDAIRRKLDGILEDLAQQPALADEPQSPRQENAQLDEIDRKLNQILYTMASGEPDSLARTRANDGRQ